VVFFIIDKDPIYDVEGISQVERVGVSYLEVWSSYMHDLDIWKLDDDMVTYLFRPFEDDVSQHI
jgi:hypothetical protein